MVQSHSRVPWQFSCNPTTKESARKRSKSSEFFQLKYIRTGGGEALWSLRSEVGKMAVSFEREAESPAGQRRTLGPDQSLPSKQLTKTQSTCLMFSTFNWYYSLSSKLRYGVPGICCPRDCQQNSIKAV